MSEGAAAGSSDFSEIEGRLRELGLPADADDIAAIAAMVEANRQLVSELRAARARGDRRDR